MQEARRVVAALHRMGMRVWMLTGDTRWGGGRGKGGRGALKGAHLKGGLTLRWGNLQGKGSDAR